MIANLLITAMVSPAITASGVSTKEPCSCPPEATAAPIRQSPWAGWGGDDFNNRWAAEGAWLDSQSATNLSQHCQHPYHRGVSATPVVVEDTAYYPTWSGSLVAFNFVQCMTVWELDVMKYVNSRYTQSKVQKKLLFQTSRTSPALDGDVLYIGTQPQALVIAVDRLTGEPIADIPINPHPFAVITQSPTFHDGKLFVGASSREEAAVRAIPGYQCCSFIGNMVALELERGECSSQFHVLWNVTMLPTDTRWSGVGIWGSQPSVDVKRQQIFIATGNVYTAPEQYQECKNKTKNLNLAPGVLTSDPCVPRDVWQESVLALDMRTGEPNWINTLSPLDAWTAACGFGGSIQKPHAGRLPEQCPYQPGPDADFGIAPTFVPGSKNTPYGNDVVVVGQKDGNLYALSAQAGRLYWATSTSPGGNVGGLIWGIAVDDSQVYYTAVNSDRKAWQLQPSNRTIHTSAFGSAFLLNGSITWETESPHGAFSIVPPTVAGDVVFVGRTGNGSKPAHAQYFATDGGLVPINKKTGQILEDYPLQANFHGGIAVVKDHVLFGTGYEPPYNGTGSFYVYRAE